MSKYNWTIRIIDRGYKFSRDIYIFRRVGNGTEFIMPNGEAEIFQINQSPDKPLLELEPEQLQALADELANVGYKPQKGFIEGKLEGTERHLEDLRTMLKLTIKSKPKE